MSWLSGYLGNQPSGDQPSGASSRQTRSTRNETVNYNEDSEEEDLETGLNFDSPLTSPGRPAQSPSVSPRALLIPDPPTTEEVLQGVNSKLGDLPTGVEVVEEGLVVGLPDSDKVEVENPLPEEEIMPDVVAFQAEDGQDGEKAMDNLRTVHCPFNKDDVEFWFSQLEDQLTLIGVKAQWTKKIALVRFLPPEIQSEVKSLLKLNQVAAGNNIYLRIKTELLELFGQKPEDAYQRAKNRVMTGKPSQLGKAIMDDLTDGNISCNNCAKTVWGMFRESLPIVVRNHVADLPFTKDTYREVFRKADQVWDSNRASEPLPSRQVAAVAAPAPSGQDVAAIQRNKGQNGQSGKNKNKGQNSQNGQGQNGQSNKNKGQGQGQDNKTAPKPKINEDNLCKIHAKWKENATF